MAIQWSLYYREIIARVNNSFNYKNFKWKKFYPGLGLELGPLAFRANAITNWPIQDKYESTIDFFS